eukprot:IDg1358t1
MAHLLPCMLLAFCVLQTTLAQLRLHRIPSECSLPNVTPTQRCYGASNLSFIACGVLTPRYRTSCRSFCQQLLRNRWRAQKLCKARLTRPKYHRIWLRCYIECSIVKNKIGELKGKKGPRGEKIMGIVDVSQKFRSVRSGRLVYYIIDNRKICDSERPCVLEKIFVRKNCYRCRWRGRKCSRSCRMRNRRRKRYWY